MPSAPDSFFANTCAGVRYQDYVIDELTARLPELLRITRRREWTAVAGMSMGGTSAFRLGMAAPERFGVIGCLCFENLWMNDMSNRVHAYAVKHVFGVVKIQDIEGMQYDFYVDALRNVREHRPLPRIFHACGQQDHALAHARATAEWFRQRMRWSMIIPIWSRSRASTTMRSGRNGCRSSCGFSRRRNIQMQL